MGVDRRWWLTGPWHGRAAFAGAADLFGHRPVAVAALAALALRDGLGPVALARRHPTRSVAEGMQALPQQLAGNLADATIRTAAEACAIEGTRIRLLGGETISARAVVVATDGSTAARLAVLTDLGVHARERG
nr:FAD-dependent oxidoreductase [Nocardia carnea]